jgi:hypothetical protein
MWILYPGYVDSGPGYACEVKNMVKKGEGFHCVQQAQRHSQPAGLHMHVCKPHKHPTFIVALLLEKFKL